MKIAVIPNINKDKDLTETKRVIEAIGERAEIIMDKAFDNGGFLATFTDTDILSGCDVAIVLGGDGTILQIARECAKRDIAILGINLGRIGFMSEVDKEEMPEAIDKLISGEYKVENRMMLKADIKRDGKHFGTYHALNDAVMLKTAEVKLISSEIYCGDEKISEYVCDGIIISTPTGSTGYSLSAGGPVINPNMELLAVTPICAHQLTAKPMIIPCDLPVTLKLGDFGVTGEAVVTLDGDTAAYIKAGDEIVVSKSEYQAKLIRMGSNSFYDTLIKKLS